MEIRLLQSEELPKLQKFLHDNWKADHIFVTNKKLFDYQHWNGKDYNFVIAIDNGEILCVLGFIPTSQYDSKITRKDIWLAIWKRLDSPKSKGLGIKLLEYIEETYHPDSIATVGMNPNTEQLYLDRGWKTGVMNHYYVANVGKTAWYKETEKLPCYPSNFDQVPQKSPKYVSNRYFKHPFYKYINMVVDHSLIIYRYIPQPKVLRIVDIIGEPPANMSHTFQQLMDIYKVGYIDCLNYGVPKEKFFAMGMVEKPSNLILPNWFEPFDPTDHPVLFSYKAEGEYIIYKGDSDQDRPNILITK